MYHAAVKVGQNVPELSSWSDKIITLHSWAPNLLSSCRTFGLSLPELCAEVLNPVTVSAPNLAKSHNLLVLRLQMRFYA